MNEVIARINELARKVKAGETLTPEELEGKLVIGELSRDEFPELTEQYQKIIDKFAK